MTIAQAGGSGVFEPMFASLRRISDAEAAAVRARRLQVVKVGPGDTVQSLAGRMAYLHAQLDRTLVLNRLNSDARLVPGQLAKLVVY